MNIYKLKYTSKQEAISDLISKSVCIQVDDDLIYGEGIHSVVEIGLIILENGVYDDELNEITPPIYVNGVLRGTTNSTLGIGTPSSFDLKIGAMGLNSIYEFQGYIDISKIYNRALSNEEVLKNYNATKSRFGL
jgi:hypothetical protein